MQMVGRWKTRSIICNTAEKRSSPREMDKEGMVHIYNGILLSHEEECDNAICSNMDRP